MSLTILFFTCHVKFWAKRRVALVWPCSALAVTLISPILDSTLILMLFKNPFSLILVSLFCRDSLFVINVDLPPFSTLIVAVILDIYFYMLFSQCAYFYLGHKHINGKLLKRRMRYICATFC